MPAVRPDPEWQAWEKEWKAEGAPLPDLERKVRVQGRLRVLGAAAGVLVGASFLAFAGWRAWRRPEPPVVVWAIAVWVFVIALTGFLLWTHRGTWRPAAATTRDFLRISRRRCLGNLEVIRFTRWFLLAEVLFVAAWSLWVHGASAAGLAAGLRAGAVRYMLALLFAAGTLVWLRWYGRRNRDELARLEALGRDLEGD